MLKAAQAAKAMQLKEQEEAAKREEEVKQKQDAKENIRPTNAVVKTRTEGNQTKQFVEPVSLPTV
jgi:hypothetical protein